MWLGAFLSIATIANDRIGMAGCGIASIAVTPQTDGAAAATAYSTNMASSQSVSITFGISNCDISVDERQARIQEEFLRGNLSRVLKEIAQGEGPALNAFAETLGCPLEDGPGFNRLLKVEAPRILNAPDVAGILSLVKSRLKLDPRFNRHCTSLA